MDENQEGTANAGYVRSSFWNKAQATLGRIPFTAEAVAAFYSATDPNTPAPVKAALVAALAYFIAPADMIPDFIAALGYTDDAAVLFAVTRLLGAHITDGHRERAKQFLGGA